MITPDEIKKKTLRIWNSGRILTAWCRNENVFPIEIPFGKIGGTGISDNYNEISRSIEELKTSSKEQTGRGYSVEFRTVSHRQLGKQNIPARIFIETEEDFLFLCGKKKDCMRFRNLYLTTEKTIPLLCTYIENNPLSLINHESQ